MFDLDQNCFHALAQNETVVFEEREFFPLHVPHVEESVMANIVRFDPFDESFENVFRNFFLKPVAPSARR